ncbi:MAG TPA: glycosyl hydrolase [Thermoanaerobaculia bacterium]|nr:glycosyl hydrolase [Thermoanaerobaculia bacterium]
MAGVPSAPFTFYFGSIGGGVWKTTDAGTTWNNVSDGFFAAGSVGAIAVAESDPNVVYVGTGTACLRTNVSPGVGMYRSSDGGKTWVQVGLRDAGQIGRVRVHPTNPDLVYAAVLGNVFEPTPTRGVFRSKDGGKTWEKVLFVDDETGASDVAIDPADPRVLYAGTWTVERRPWTLDSGSTRDGIWKSTDGGDTWTRLAGGLPTGIVGRTTVALSRSRPGRVWALMDAAVGEGGLFRSDDAGATWQRVNEDPDLTARAFYFGHLIADPVDADTVYVLNIGLMKSVDGGKSFTWMEDQHEDHHDLWLNPANPKILIEGNDGGATVSLNGGATWSTQLNQPTAEIYRVATDNRYPFRVYGAQQDSGTVSVPSASRNIPLELMDYYQVAGGEASHIAVDPRDADIVYATISGQISRTDAGRRMSDLLYVYPEPRGGTRAADMKYRTPWNQPVRISPHDPDVLYTTSQYVHRSRDGGRTWQVISPDLTRNDKSKQETPGLRRLPYEGTGAEIYDTVFAFEESPVRQGVLWAGSDDGLVHVSTDDGKTWTNVTPPDMPEWGTVNSIEPSVHDPGRAVIAVFRHMAVGDFQPYVFRTDDYGRTWQRLTDGRNGIPADHFVRVVREDKARRGLLYAGTEFGMYVSFDDGAHWQPLQLNLPVVPISDLQVKDRSLVMSTFGRGFWLLDDLSVLEQLTPGTATDRHRLFAPREGVRPAANGSYPPVDGGATIWYYLAADVHPVTIEIRDQSGGRVAKYESLPPGEELEPSGLPLEFDQVFGGRNIVTAHRGLNQFRWTTRHSPPYGPEPVDSLFGFQGPYVVPGDYQVTLTAGEWSATETLTVRPDPRVKTTTAEYEAQFRLARELGGRLRTLREGIAHLREVRGKLEKIAADTTASGEVVAESKRLTGDLSAIEAQLTRVKGQRGPRLDSKLSSFYKGVVDSDLPPSAAIEERARDLLPEVDRTLAAWADVSSRADAWLAQHPLPPAASPPASNP